MKKIFALAVALGISSIAYADHTINLSTTNLTCGKYKVTTSSTAAELRTNCKVVKAEFEKEFFGKEEEIKFNADDGSYVKCKFHNDKLTK